VERVTEPTPKPNCFVVRATNPLGGPNCTWRFAAQSQQDMNSWILAINEITELTLTSPQGLFPSVNRVSEGLRSRSSSGRAFGGSDSSPAAKWQPPQLKITIPESQPVHHVHHHQQQQQQQQQFRPQLPSQHNKPQLTFQEQQQQLQQPQQQRFAGSPRRSAGQRPLRPLSTWKVDEVVTPTMTVAVPPVREKETAPPVYYVALYDYQGVTPEELAITEGVEIRFLQEVGEW